jgi:hypothetical protein
MAARTCPIAEQVRHLRRIGPEFGRKTQFRMFGRNPNADAQFKIGCALGGAHNLLQFFMTVEAECTNAVVVISLRDGTFGFYRVHEAQFRIRQKLVHQPGFAKRCNIIMGNAGIPKKLKQGR